MEEGIFYHVYNRGNNSERIFREKENYLFFLQRYKKYLLPHVDTYAYCLMPTHFHFLSCVKETTRKASKTSLPGKPGYRKLTPLEKAYRDFFISYAKSFNKRFDRTGSLFQYKFKRKPVKDKKHLLRLVLYIHANPLQAGLCKSYEEWQFSSYKAIVGSAPTLVQRETVRDWFGGRETFVRYHQDYANNVLFQDDDGKFNQIVSF